MKYEANPIIQTFNGFVAQPKHLSNVSINICISIHFIIELIVI